MANQPVADHSNKQETSFWGEIKQQWPLVLALFFMQVFAFGFPTFSLPFVYAGATDEFGWTREQAVLLASFKFYVSAAAALVVGRMLDAINPKHVVTLSAVLGAIGMAAFMVADRLAVYYLIGIVLGLSATGLAIAINVIASRAFQRSTGTMLGIVLSGTSVAGMLLPILMAPLMKTVGWRPAMAALGFGIWLVSLPVWFLVFRRGSLSAMRLRNASEAVPKFRMWDHIKTLAGTRNFWFIFGGGLLAMGVNQSLVQNQVLFLHSEKGLSLEAVAWGASLLAGVGIGAKVFFGWIFDKLSIPGIVICYLLLAVSVGLSFTVVGVGSMLVFMTVRGIAHAGVMICGAVLIKHHYGMQNLGINIGIFTLSSSLGFGLLPPLMAGMADRSGSYSEAFIMGTAAVLLAAALLYPVKPKYWSRH